MNHLTIYNRKKTPKHSPSYFDLLFIVADIIVWLISTCDLRLMLVNQ